MPYTYRWALGEEAARKLARMVSGCDEWRRIENTAKCGDVTCHKYEYMLEGDTGYRAYWLCWQRTNAYPDPDKESTTIGWCCDGAMPDLPKQRLKNGLEKIYRNT